MSKYTTEVRYICESYAGLKESAGFDSVDKILTTAAPKVFNFDFPIFDENYRLPLEKKILLHYYTREIGMETVGLWKLKLNARLLEIMPYYNQLYKSELLSFNPFYDVDLKTEHTSKSNGTTSGETSDKSSEKYDSSVETNTDTSESGSNESSSTSTTNDTIHGTSTVSDTDKYSETPQGGIQNLENDQYLTNARLKSNSTVTDSTDVTANDTKNTGKDQSSSTSESTTDTEGSRTTSGSSTNKSTATNTEEYIETVSGKTGGTSYAARLKEFRETLLNIDLQIINELGDLFFGLWE